MSPASRAAGVGPVAGPLARADRRWETNARRHEARADPPAPALDEHGGAVRDELGP